MPHPRFTFHTWPAAVYAIGDVHGCLRQLLDLEARIIDDARSIEGEKWLVTLGDHIDRGPNSRGVIAHLMGLPPRDFRRFALLGNHEAMALSFFAGDDPHGWLDQGGSETLASYGVEPRQEPDAIARRFPPPDRALLDSLGLYLSLPGWLFVHAGIRPGIALADQSEDDLTWIREPFLSSQLTGGLRIVHGHTPGRDVTITPHRINVDTACFASGKLSAVRVEPNGRTRVFSTD